MTEEEVAVTKHMKVRQLLLRGALVSVPAKTAEELQPILDTLSVSMIEYNWENKSKQSSMFSHV